MLKLIKNQQIATFRYPKKHRIIPVCYLPLAAMLENMSVKQAIYKSKLRLNKHCSNFLVSIAIDRWHCKNPDFFKIYQELITNSTMFISPIGPSTYEFKKSNLDCKTLDKIGVNNFEGGSDLNILTKASEKNFILRPSIAVDLELGFNSELRNKIHLIEKLSTLNTSIETLTLFPKNKLITKDNEKEYKKILNQARLLAKSIPFFRAPLSAFNNFSPKQYYVNDYGHIAIDIDTSQALDIPMLNDEYKKLLY